MAESLLEQYARELADALGADRWSWKDSAGFVMLYFDNDITPRLPEVLELTEPRDLRITGISYSDGTSGLHMLHQPFFNTVIARLLADERKLHD